MTSEMAAAIDFCRTLRPEILDGAMGSEPQLIEQLESAQAKPVSASHRALLEAFGESFGGLVIHELTIKPADLIRAHSITEGPMPDGFELIGLGTDEPFEDLFLVDGGYDRPVLEFLNTRVGCSYRNLPGDQGSLVAGSCAEWIARNAFQQCLPNFEQKGSYFRHFSEDPPALSNFADLCTSLGIPPLPFSNSITHACSSRDVIAMGTFLPESGLSILLGARTDGAFNPIHKAITLDLKVNPE